MCTNYKENEKKGGDQDPCSWAFVSRYLISVPGLGLLICGMAKLLCCLSPNFIQRPIGQGLPIPSAGEKWRLWPQGMSRRQEAHPGTRCAGERVIAQESEIIKRQGPTPVAPWGRWEGFWSTQRSTRSERGKLSCHLEPRLLAQN